jgi:osmotically-inducible protein OsmY
MNQRDDTQGNEHVERGREANGGRGYYPGSHGFDETHDRPQSQDAARHDRERWNNGFERQRHEQRGDPGRGGPRGGWDANRGYGAGGGNYGSRAYGSDRPSGQDPSGFGQRTHWSEPQPLYGRQQPFGPPEDTHYYGTGSAGYGGPGFTGGAYAYGNGPRDQERQIADEYSDESAVSYEQGPRQQYGQRQYNQYSGRPYGQPQGQRYSQPSGSQYDSRQGQQFRQQPYGNDRYSGYPDTHARRFTTGPKGYQRSDERLKEDISERLMESHHIDSSDVSVEVRGAKVVLEGTVPSRHMKHAIEDLVDACPGVQDIDNRVRVANQTMRQGQGGQSQQAQTLTGSGTGIGSGTGTGIGGSSGGGVAASGSTPNGVNTPNGTKSR